MELFTGESLFNTREVSSFIWFSFLLLWALIKKQIRESLFTALKSLFQKQIASTLVAIFVYVSITILLLYKAGFWNISMLKDSIVWMLFSAVVVMISTVTSKNEEKILKKLILDNLKVVALLEFVINTYTFSIIGELVFVPLVSLIVILKAFTEASKEYELVDKILGWLLAVIGFAIIGVAGSKMLNDYQNFQSISSIKNFLLPIILTISFIPFLYSLLLYSFYEDLFVRLEMGPDKNKKLKKLAKVSIIKKFKLNLWSLKKFSKNHLHDVMKVRSPDDIDKLL
jgi:hypothetical protein